MFNTHRTVNAKMGKHAHDIFGGMLQDAIAKLVSSKTQLGFALHAPVDVQIASPLQAALIAFQDMSCKITFALPHAQLDFFTTIN